MFGVLDNASRIRIAALAAAAACALILAAFEPLSAAFSHLSFPLSDSKLAAGSAITVTRAEAQSADTVVTSIDDVHTQAQLVAYANGLMQADSHISQIQLTDHSVSMTYETTNSVLNVRTISDMTTATVSDSGTVAVSGSWYRPFFTHVAQASAPNIGFSDIVMSHGKKELTPETQARILSRLNGRFRIGALQ